MAKYTHFIKLTPLERFCFGGESYADEDNKVFYFQRSGDFPQQTSVLGLVRYQLLKQAGYLEISNGRERLTNKAVQKQNDHNEAMAQLLIGSQGFDPVPENCPTKFGVIEQLSPVFITSEVHRHLLPFPKVKAWDDQNETKKEIQYHWPRYSTLNIDKSESSKQPIGRAYLMGKAEKVAAHPLSLLQNYNPKYDIEYGFKDCEGEGYIAREDIFNDDLEPQIGIFKTHTLEHRKGTNAEDNSEQEGFFKIQYKRLKQGYAFGFYISLSNSYEFKTEPMVFWGKERSPFRMEVEALAEEQQTPFDKPLPSVEKGQYLWAASNAKINPQEIYTYCDTVCSDEESFRCMVSRVDQNCNYYGRPQKRKGSAKPKDQILFSGRYNLLKRGSLLRIKDSLSEEQLQSFSNTAFQLIGYNHFLIFNPQQ